MNDACIRRAREALFMTERDLARQLGVSTGCLRRWSRRGAPPYIKLALAALVAGLDPDEVWPTAAPLGRRHDGEVRAE